jgi:hypothetical protein
MALKQWSRQLQNATAVWMPTNEPVFGSILTSAPSEVKDKLEYEKLLSNRIGGLLDSAENPKELVLDALDPVERATLNASPFSAWPEAIVTDLESVRVKIGDAVGDVTFPIRTGKHGRQLRDVKAMTLDRWVTSLHQPDVDLLSTNSTILNNSRKS